MGCLRPNVGCYSGSFRLHGRKIARFRKIRNQAIKFLTAFLNGEFSAHVPNRIFEYNPGDHTGLIFLALPQIFACMIKEIIKRFRPGLVSYGGHYASLCVLRKCLEHRRNFSHLIMSTEVDAFAYYVIR